MTTQVTRLPNQPVTLPWDRCHLHSDQNLRPRESQSSGDFEHALLAEDTRCSLLLVDMGEGPPAWYELVQIGVGIAASIVAIVAFGIARFTARNAQELARVQTFVSLRNAFLPMYRELGSDPQSPSRSRISAQDSKAYWQHVFDEWFVSKHLAPKTYGALWDDFFAGVTAVGMRDPDIRRSFEEMSLVKGRFGKYTEEFLSAIQPIYGQVSSEMLAQSSESAAEVGDSNT